MRRQVAATLLALAISPITAPFLTLDITHLLSDEAPAVAAIVDAKKPQDEPLATPATVAALAVPEASAAELLCPHASLTLLRQPRNLPLRI